MKYIVLGLLFSSLCNFVKGQTLISGQIDFKEGRMPLELVVAENPTDKEIPFRHMIPVADDGTFEIALENVQSVTFADIFVTVGEGKNRWCVGCPVFLEKGKNVHMNIEVGKRSCRFFSSDNAVGALAAYCNFNLHAQRALYDSLEHIRNYKWYIENFYRKAEDCIRDYKPVPEVAGYLRLWGGLDYLRYLDDFPQMYAQVKRERFPMPDDYYDFELNPAQILDNDQLLLFDSGPRSVGRYLDRQLPSVGLKGRLKRLQEEFKHVRVVDAVAEMEISEYMSGLREDKDYTSELEELMTCISDTGKREALIMGYRDKCYRVVGANFPGVELKDRQGKHVSFDQFKGKYVYVDLWASWCGPCCAEVPFLKRLEEKYEDKVTFVSISIDSSWEAWMKKMDQLEMEGVLLLNQDNTISKLLNVRGIPRFLIYDPEGHLYMLDAPRPSSSSVEELLDGLK